MNLPPWLIRLLALLFLVVQNASVALVMRYSLVVRTPDQEAYLPVVAVFTQEALKFFFSLLFICMEQQFNALQIIETLSNSLNVKDLLNISVPAFLYVVQNNLLYLASANISPAPLQLLFQLKIFTTAILSVLILNKKLTRNHWISLFALFCGIAVVQYSIDDGSASNNSSSTSSNQNAVLGLGAIFIAVTCSGLAGVWFEKILKKKDVSLWVSNFQLSLISIFIALFTVYLQHDKVDGHLFRGFTSVVWAVVFLQSFGGLLIAIVVKYTDNIIKAYATSIATILSTIGSMYFFQFQASQLFLVGSLVVLASAYAYTVADTKPSPAVAMIKEDMTDEESEAIMVNRPSDSPHPKSDKNMDEKT